MTRRTVGALVLGMLGVAALAWLGFGVYQAGYVQGAAGEGTEVIVGWGSHPGLYGIGVIGIMFKALFALLFFGLIARLLVFRPWAHAGHGHRGFGPAGARKEEFRHRMDQHLTEWHDRAHAEPGEGEASDAEENE